MVGFFKNLFICFALLLTAPAHVQAGRASPSREAAAERAAGGTEADAEAPQGFLHSRWVTDLFPFSP